MFCLADCTPLLWKREVDTLSRNFQSKPLGRSRNLLEIACVASLFAITISAQAQFSAEPVGTTSDSQIITVTVAVAGTVTNVEVLTWGSTSGDFAKGTVSTNCSGFLSVNSECTQSVSFTPISPGLRLGAVVLVGTPSGGSDQIVLGTTYVSGVGAGGLGVLVAGNTIPVAGQFQLYRSVQDGVPATQSELFLPRGAVLDGAGNMYIADSGHNRIRMVCAGAGSATIAGTDCTGAGIITTIAGNGGSSGAVCGAATDPVGDGCPASQATVSNPGYVALDGAGNLYIADSGDNVIRMISAATGIITTVAGNANGTVCAAKTDPVGDGCPAPQAILDLPQGVTIDASGNLYIADTNNHRIREVSAATGNISTVAGSGFTNPDGTGGYNSDNIPAGTAELNYPYAVAFDSAGNMYIPDSANNRVREVLAAAGSVSASSTIITFAGNGSGAATVCSLIPPPAIDATVWSPSGVAVDAAGNVYIAESQNAAIIKVSGPASPTPGTYSLVVQNGCGTFYFDGQFSGQELYGPTGLYLDGMGDLYVADTLNMVVREVQGNDVALDFVTPVRQTEISPTLTQPVENDGNAALELTMIVAATNAEIDPTVADSCTDSETLAVNVQCEVGAVFAPAATPFITINTLETPSIDVAENTQPTLPAINSPLNIELVGMAAPIASTTTTVTSSPNPSGFGQSVTFTVTVNAAPGTGSLTGTVNISDTFGGNTTSLALGLSLNASGVATFSISTLAVGQHSIIASYNSSNDPAHLPSTSTPALVQTVLEGTAVSLTSSVNPSAVGQSVTFTATVTSSGGGVNPTGTITIFDGSTALSTLTLGASGVVTYATSALAHGPHQITAVYNGSASTQVQSSTSPVLNQDVQAASAITVVSSLNPSTYAASVTFMATVTSNATSPATGTVNFLDNGISIGTGSLAGTPGAATLTTSALTVGTHPITVTYAGDNFNTASSSAAPLNQVVNQASTVTTVSATPTPGSAATPETISATVALAVGAAIPAGTVTFTSAGTTLGSATLNSSGVAIITPTLAAGSYQIVATYSGAASINGSASAPLSCTIALTTTQTVLTVAPDPALILTPITFAATVSVTGPSPTGSVNFLANGVIIGTATLNSNGVATFSDSTLPAGSYSMTAVYLGNSTDATSTSPAVSETVGIISTTTVLGTATTSGTNSEVILVATVLNDGTGLAPAGTVTFYNGTASLGTATLDSSGVGVATVASNLVSGTDYNVDAVYSGDADHSASTSQMVSVAGTALKSGSGIGFTVTVTPATVSVESSQNITINVTLASTGSSTDTVDLGCASLPPVVNCHFASVSLNLPAGGTVSTQLTIDTNNPLSGGTTAMDRRSGVEKFSLSGLFLPIGLGFGGIFWRLRQRNRGIFTTALILVLTAAAFVASGCNSFSQAGAAPGTYVIQVTGTGTTTNVIEYQNVTLNITK